MFIYAKPKNTDQENKKTKNTTKLVATSENLRPKPEVPKWKEN